MPKSCAVCGAVMRRGGGRSFHRFPIDPEKRSKWVCLTGREHFIPNKETVLCSDHFEDHCFDRTGQTIRLREDSMPTLFGGLRKQLVEPLNELSVKKEIKLEEDSVCHEGLSVTVDHCYALACPETAKKKIAELQRENETLKKTVKSNRQRERRLARKWRATLDVLQGLKCPQGLTTNKAQEMLGNILGSISLELFDRKNNC
ncbi:THAP domain-containing protein 2 [Pelodytes ibericus]